jgi:hypothetical protein
MSRYLVVANQTIGGSELMDEIRRRIATGPSSFYVLVPSMPVALPTTDVLPAAGDTGGIVVPDLSAHEQDLRDRAEKVNQSRLSQLTSQIRAEGAAADGRVGTSDPVKAIDAVIAEGGFDEIIISTLPAGVSRWLRMDVPNRVKRKFTIPVTTVTAKK